VLFDMADPDQMNVRGCLDLMVQHKVARTHRCALVLYAMALEYSFFWRRST